VKFRRIRPTDLTDTWLVGYREIARFVRLSPRQVQRYAKAGDLPVFRLGCCVVTSRGFIMTWLMTREQLRRERARAARPPGGQT